MGHNRGWEEAASMLTGASIELKTCNAALLEATGKSWDEVSLLSFHYYFLTAVLPFYMLYVNLMCMFNILFCGDYNFGIAPHVAKLR